MLINGVLVSGGVKFVADAVNLGDPYFSNVALLTNTSATNNLTNNTLLDSSVNNITITNNGRIPQGTFSPFPIVASTPYSALSNGGSAYFDGSTMYFNMASNAAFSFGTADFTVECWIYTGAPPGGGVTKDKWIFGDWSIAAPYILCFLHNATNKLGFFNGIDATGTSSTAVPTNTWTHCAWVRQGNVVSFYINGVASGSATFSTSRSFAQAAPYVGKNPSANDRYFPGFIASLRITKSAVYTSGFTPSTTPLTALANTTFLVNFTNAGIYDTSKSTNILSTLNSAKTSNAQTNFAGYTSILFNSGTSDSIVWGSGLTFGTGNFTIEGWVYTSTSSSSMGIIGFCDSTPTNANTSFRINTNTGKLNSIACSGTTAYTCASASNLPTSSWVHIAFVRNGSTLTQYINGTADGTSTIGASSVNDSTAQLFALGKQGLMTSNYWNGYLQQFRITKGVARYTSNFTPPTQPFLSYGT